MDKVLKEFIQVIFSGNLMNAAIEIIKELINSGVEVGMQAAFFNARFYDFINHQNDMRIREQIRNIVDEMQKQFAKLIDQKNIAIIALLGEYLDKEFNECEIDRDIRKSLKEGLILCMKCYICNLDIYFSNDIALNEEIQKNQELIERCHIDIKCLKEEMQLTKIELEKVHSIPVIAGTTKLDIRNADRLDKRANEILEIEERFAMANNVVVLYGRPGMGKTTLAKLYANEFSTRLNEKCTIYFVRYESSIEHTVSQLSSNLKKYKGEEILKYWEKLSPDKCKNILLIIDNFNEDILMGSDKRKFFDELSGVFFERLVDCGIHILITTRIKLRDDSYVLPKVSDPFELFKQYAGSELQESDREYVEQIIKALCDNTMLIVLAAHLWKKNKKARRELVNKIYNFQIEDYSDSVSHEVDVRSEEQTIYGQAKALLDFSGILNDENVKSVFENIALLPLSGIDKETFLEFIDSTDANVVDGLINDSWILEEGSYIFMHPVLREIVINEEMIHYNSCLKYCENIEKEISIGKTFENRLKYKNHAWEIFNMFCKESMSEMNLVNLSYGLSDIYDEVADRKRSLEVAKKVYEHINVFDNDKLRKAECLSGIAYSWNNYFESMEDLNWAEKLLVQAWEVYESINENEVVDIVKYNQVKGKILSNFGSNCISKGHFAKTQSTEYFNTALEYHEKALKHREGLLRSGMAERINCDNPSVIQKISSGFEGDVAISRTNIGTTKFYLKDYENALICHEDAYEKRKKLNYIKLVNDNQHRMIGIVIEMYRKDFKVSKKKLKKVLDFYPQLLQNNHYFEMYGALEANIDFFVLISRIILNDKRYKKLREKIKNKRKQIYDWLKTDIALKEKFEAKLFDRA